MPRTVVFFFKKTKKTVQTQMKCHHSANASMCERISKFHASDDWGTGTSVRCTINRSHSTPCKKAEFEHLQIFPGHCLAFFLSVSGKICHSPIKKVKRQPTFNLVFSAFSVLWGTVKKSGLKSDPRQTLPGECAGESVTK